MKNNPLVSVVMNCYNSDTYLREAIESVINQTYENWEIIFWDNQSTDNSAKIVKSYKDERIKYYYAPYFTPLGKARNLAIEKSNANWIAFLDCDDFWDNKKLFLSMKALKKVRNKDTISLIYSKSNVINKDNKIILKINKSPSGDIHNRLLIEGDFIVFSSLIFKKNILNRYGNINEKLNYCEDYDLLLKITKEFQVIGVNEYLTYYRMHENNITSKTIYDNDTEVLQLLENYISNNDLDFNIKYNILINNSYRIGTLIGKLLLKKEFKNTLMVLMQYFHYIILFPIAIIKVKFLNE